MLIDSSFSFQISSKLQIKVSGQSGGLGISIAGGIGSMPYKDHDEVRRSLATCVIIG